MAHAGTWSVAPSNQSLTTESRQRLNIEMDRFAQFQTQEWQGRVAGAFGISAMEEMARVRLAPMSETATSRARALLLENLSPKQKAQFLLKDWFSVDGKLNRYRIRYSTTYNVDVINDGGFVSSSLCAVPLGRVPIPDSMLAQKLVLENDEELFMRVAHTLSFSMFGDVGQILPAR
jgi:hypothetical protein